MFKRLNYLRFGIVGAEHSGILVLERIGNLGILFGLGLVDSFA